jgi:hypothetical protein
MRENLNQRKDKKMKKSWKPALSQKIKKQRRAARKSMEIALFKGRAWAIEHNGYIARKIASRGTTRSAMGALRTLKPVSNTNRLKDSKGTEYKYLRNGQLVRV